MAIKIYDKFKLHANQMVKKSVSREIKLLASLTCPGSKGPIMQLYDAIDTPKQLYLVVEYIPGKMLSQLLRERPSLAEEAAFQIWRQII